MMKLDAKKIAAILFFELVIVLVIATISLRLWEIDFSVPFNYWGDTLWFMVPIKGMIENGWTYLVPQLSAPFSLSAAAFPSMSHLDWSIMWIISLFSSDAGVVLNIFWLLSMVLTAWFATLALSLLGVEVWLAVGMGILYSFMPFTLLRNVAHISLVFYCVPFLILLAIYFARGSNHPNSGIIRFVGYSAALAQGFNYIYFSFFAVLIFAFSGWLGFMQKKSWEPIRGAAIAISIIILAAALNLLPSFLSWHTYGKPIGMDYKTPQEAEIYGLKIRKLVAPHEDNILPIFKQWGEKDHSINFPNENENVTARLGPMAALGLIFLLLVSLGLTKQHDSYESKMIKSIASLSLFVLLFTTVGGLGAIFNEIIPDIRAYNRFSVFLGFLALVAISLWWQMQIKIASTQRIKTMILISFVTLTIFSLYDQLLDAKNLNNRRITDEISANNERKFVQQIESKVLPGTLVFQLPITGFPSDGGQQKMLPYDHARPYMWSSQLHWSWPSFSIQHSTWLDQLTGLQGTDLVEALVLSKFKLIWIDRFGYSDNGEEIISSILSGGAKEILPGMSTRYVALDLTGVAARLQQQMGFKEFSRRQAEILQAPTIIWDKGVYQLETTPDGQKFRWSKAKSTATIYNFSEMPYNAVLSFFLKTEKKGKLTILSKEGNISMTATQYPVKMQIPLFIKPNSSIELNFISDIPMIDLPAGETRDLHFILMDIQLHRIQNLKS